MYNLLFCKNVKYDVTFSQESISNFTNPNQLKERLRKFPHKLGNRTPIDQHNRKETIDELVKEIVDHLEALLPSKILTSNNWLNQLE